MSLSRTPGSRAGAPTPHHLAVAFRGLRDHAVFLLDAGGITTDWNPGVERILGWAEGDWLGQPVSVILASEAAGSIDAAALLRRADEHGSADFHGSVARHDGERFHSLLTISALCDESDRVEGYVVTVSDRSELNASVSECQRLLESERRLRAVAERRAAEIEAALASIPDAMYIGDARGITRCNANGLAMLGASSIDELQHDIGELGRRFRVRTLRHGEAVPPQQLPFVRALQGEASVGETWATRLDTGEDVYIRGAASPVRVDGVIVGAVAVNSDLTSHKRAQDAQRRLSQIVEHSGELIAMVAPKGELLYINRAGREVLGLPDTDALPPAMELVHPDERARVEAEIVPVLRQYKPWAGEVQLAHHDTGRPISLLWSAFAVHDGEAEHPQVWAFIGHDLTRTKRIEMALSERDQQVRALVNGVRDYAIFTVGTDGNISTWHEGAELMKGYSHEEAVGMPFAQLFRHEDRVAGRPEMEMAIAAATGEYTGEGMRRRKDGSHFDAFVVLTAMRGPEGELLGFLKLTQDITSRKRQEAEREQMLTASQSAREDAERASRMKNDFLATISHELRTPLGAILGWSRLLERGHFDAQGIHQGLAAISRNATIQSRLIDDLLDMGRIESGHLRLQRAPVDVAMVVAAGLDAVGPAAEAKHIGVTTRIDPATPTVLADFERMQQVLWNLISNAIKFTPDGGAVAIEAMPSELGALITVADNGQGIVSAFLPHVFDRFSQHDSSITRRQGGLGIGLSLVKQLVELHGGRVAARSGGEGMGAVFSIELPSAVAVPAFGSTPALPESPPPGADQPLAGVKVLFVDDEPDSREVARLVLEQAGARFLEASNAVDALRAIERERPDVLLSDIGMPGHDGFELISWVRALGPTEGGRTPAAAVTAYTSPEDRARALEAGFQIHVAKPVEVDRWIDTVLSLHAQREGPR